MLQLLWWALDVSGQMVASRLIFEACPVVGVDMHETAIQQCLGNQVRMYSTGGGGRWREDAGGWQPNRFAAGIV